jgi:predicted restriction endonuclease
MKRNYDDPAYADFRKAVLNRDKRRCRMPGCNAKTRLQVHHIKKWSSASSLRYEISNGITLCKNCHDSIKSYEEQYEAFFRVVIEDDV